MASSQSSRLHRFGGEEDGSPVDALIVMLYDKGQRAEVEELTQQWAPAVPRGAFAGLELDLALRRIDLVSVRAIIDEAAEERDLQAWQIVLLGAGRAGRLAIDLAMLGVVPGAAVIALDIPLESTPSNLAPTPGSVRMVQHSTPDDPDGARFHAVVDALQRRRVNVRSMLLPDLGVATQRATRRAAGAFLVELVAAAGRMAPGGSSWK